MIERSDQDQRKSQRKRVFKGADIILFGRAAPIVCTVRDESETGVRLKVDEAMHIPEIFDLSISNGRIQRCRVVWRTANEIGAEFLPER